MATLTFPSDPAIGQVYTFENTKYTFDGEKWKSIGLGYNPFLDSKVASREALRRSYANAGYTLVEGSFDDGGELTSVTDVLLYTADGVAYAWDGAFPKVVTAGSTPTPLGAGGWLEVSDVTLRSQLTAGGLTPAQIGNKKAAESPRLSWYADTGDDITSLLPTILADVASSTGVLIIDINCLVSTFDFTAYTGLSEIRFGTKWRTITQVSGTEAHMLIMGNDQALIGGRLLGNKASQTGIWFGAYFNSVSESGVRNMDIRNFSGNGAHFVDCTDTFCAESTIRDIGTDATELEGGQYVSNCSNHRSYKNDIRDVGNNGIKFRSDTLGGATGCESIGDRVFRAGRIGIANGRMQDHKVFDWYCVDCADNGIDFNGCDGVEFGGGTSRGCLDGVYLGENGITNSHGSNFQCYDNGRAGIGSLGSLTNCSVTDFILDGNGSGIYCSGFNGFRVANGRIANSAVITYTPPESGVPTDSTGNGIDIQTNLSSCFKLRLQNVEFASNAGKNIALGASGILADSLIEANQFASRGTAHVSLGGATLTNNVWRGNLGGWRNEIKKKFTIAASGATTLTITFASEVSAVLANSNYIVEGIVPDWGTTFRIQNKAADVLVIEFGTATPSTNRTVDITLSGLLPVY